MKIGFNTHFWWSGTTSWVDAWLDKLVKDGFYDLRIDISWSPGSGAVRPPDDQILTIVNKITSRDMSLLIMVGGFGSLATWAAPDTTQYATEVARLATLLKGKPVRFEVWNEPNYSTYSTNPIGYVALLTEAYNAIKWASPDIKVVGGAIAWNDRSWRSQFLSLRPPMDYMSIHPYTNITDPNLDPSDDDIAHNGKYSFRRCIRESTADLFTFGYDLSVVVSEIGFRHTNQSAEAQKYADACNFAESYGVESYYNYDLGDRQQSSGYDLEAPLLNLNLDPSLAYQKLLTRKLH